MAGNDRRGGRFTRRQFIQGAAAAAASSAVGARAANAAKPTELPPGHTDADINFVNGKIHTMDAQNSIVSSLSIKDGRFLSVGDTHPGPRTQVIDLRGRTVVPGIIDNHNHIVLMGNRPGYHTPLENAYSIPDVKEAHARRRHSAGCMDHHDRRLSFEPHLRQPGGSAERPPADAPGARCRRAE